MNQWRVYWIRRDGPHSLRCMLPREQHQLGLCKLVYHSEQFQWWTFTWTLIPLIESLFIRAQRFSNECNIQVAQLTQRAVIQFTDKLFMFIFSEILVSPCSTRCQTGNYSLPVLWPAIPMKDQKTKVRSTPWYSAWQVWDQSVWWKCTWDNGYTHEDFLWHVTTLTSPNIASGLIATIFVPVMPLHALHAGQAHLTIWLLRILWSVRSISEHGHCCDARVWN